MDFNALPANIFAQIIYYLPLKEQIRIGRVGKRFEEISRRVIFGTKSILLNDQSGPLRRMDADSLSNLLQLCSSNVKMIEIWNQNGSWIETLSQFICPKLFCLFIFTNYGIKFFDEIMEKNRNVRSVSLWVDDRCFTFSNNFICDNLQRLTICRANGDTIRSLTGRFPNLIGFHLLRLESPILPETYDNFFESCPKLKCFRIVTDHPNNFHYSQLKHFWRLDSLQELVSGKCLPFNDHDIQKVATCFPRLDDLRLPCTNLTNVAFISLASLENLDRLHLWRHDGNWNEDNLDLGVRQLIRGKNLRQFYMNVNISSTTLIALIRHCYNIKDLKIRRIIDVDSIEEAVAFLESLGEFKNKKIDIGFYSKSNIWKSDEVKAILLSLEVNGNMIKIS